MTPVAILLRVSTLKQETGRQEAELRAVAVQRGWQVVEVVEEKVSGAADEAKRSGLARVLELATAGYIEKVLVHEVSRLGRLNSVVHHFVERLERECVSVYWHAQGIETLLANGKRNPAAGVMLALLAEMARAERETLRERIVSGLEQAKRKGVKLGRRPGGMTPKKFLSKHADVVKRLGQGHDVGAVAVLTGKGYGTCHRVKCALKQQAA
jgi:DNA invertase Pin-like site-specific DNA recombinase